MHVARGFCQCHIRPFPSPLLYFATELALPSRCLSGRGSPSSTMKSSKSPPSNGRLVTHDRSHVCDIELACQSVYRRCSSRGGKSWLSHNTHRDGEITLIGVIGESLREHTFRDAPLLRAVNNRPAPSRSPIVVRSGHSDEDAHNRSPLTVASTCQWRAKLLGGAVTLPRRPREEPGERRRGALLVGAGGRGPRGTACPPCVCYQFITATHTGYFRIPACATARCSERGGG